MECDIYRKHPLFFTVHEAVEIRRSSKKNPSGGQTALFSELLYFISDPPKTVHILQYTCKCTYHLHFEKTGLIHAITNWYFTVNMKVYIPSTVYPVIYAMI